jgi:hypothetical protein
MVDTTEGDKMGQKKPNVIAIQNVEDDLWQKVETFLSHHKRIPSKSQLAKVALETYLAQANNFGIDGDWHPMIKDVGPDVYRKKGGQNETDQG